MKAEISFDLKMEEHMHFVEGTYRLNEGPWHVFIFSTYSKANVEIDLNAKWASGVSGIIVQYPRSNVLNRGVVLNILSNCLGVTDWNEVRGPDSIDLR
jgi:hypothetical protein